MATASAASMMFSINFQVLRHPLFLMPYDVGVDAVATIVGVCFLMLSAGPNAYARFRLPALPSLAILAALGAYASPYARRLFRLDASAGEAD